MINLNYPQRNIIQKKELPFKLIIPSQVQKKIDLMCLKINNIEWSGSLFYDYEGSWKDNNLVIKVLDFFLQDIGNTGSTTFEQSPDVVRFRIDNDLLTAQMGLIHSHHNMAAFFSGTDMNTLEKEALDHNHFVSLVVNNRRQYVAAITAVTTSQRIKQVVEKKIFTTFNGQNDETTPSTFEETEEVNEVEYVMMPIEIEDYEDSNIELINRIEEVKKEKEAKKVTTPPWEQRVNGYEHKFPIQAPNLPLQNYKNFHTQTSLFPEDNFEEYPIASEETKKVVIDNFGIPDDIIEYKAKQLITLSRVIPKDNKINIGQFIKSMPSLYKDSFEDIKHYSSFISFFVEDIVIDNTIINAFEFKEVSEEVITFDIASRIMELLKKEANNTINEYLKMLLEEIEAYLY